MKRAIIAAVIVIVALLITSCNKQNERIVNYDLIIGDWKLEEVKENGVVKVRCDDKIGFRSDSVFFNYIDTTNLAPFCKSGIVGGGPRYGIYGNWRVTSGRLILLDPLRNPYVDAPIISVDNLYLKFGIENNYTYLYKRI